WPADAVRQRWRAVPVAPAALVRSTAAGRAGRAPDGYRRFARIACRGSACRRSGLAGDDQVLLHQLILALDVVLVERDAIHRADLLALWLVVMADAFGAQVGVDDVDFLALGDRAIRALGLADVAVDAVVGDYQG